MIEEKQDSKQNFLNSLTNIVFDLDRLMSKNQEITPPELETFLYDKDYLGLPELSPRQLEALRVLDNDDPNVNKILEAVLCWGKGSGKDWIASIFFSRRVNKLLCFKSPQQLFRLPSSEPIDFLNVAVSEDQAKSVFFNKLTGMIKAAGPKAFRQFGFNPDTDIGMSKIIFPKNIRLFSGHSEQESMEGKNLYAAVMDEAAAFKTEQELKGKGPRAKRSASAIYKFLSSSIRSRFPQVGKLILISYPRFKDDFILQRYKVGQRDPQTYVSFGATWEINPLRKKSDFDKDYRDNPEQAKSMYECIPPASDEPFIREQDKILKIVDFTTKPPHDVWGQYYPEFRGKTVTYTLGLDLSLTGDRTGMALIHSEIKDGKPKTIIDLLRVWEAAKGKEIDYEEIFQEILILKSRGFNIIGVYCDQFQSAYLIQKLQKEGFFTEKVSIESKLEYWNSLKSYIYNEELKVYQSENTELFIEELQGLSLLNGNKVDHTASGSKDLCDAVVRAISGLIKKGQTEFVWKPM